MAKPATTVVVKTTTGKGSAIKIDSKLAQKLAEQLAANCGAHGATRGS